MSRREEELEKEGWVRQFVADEPRLSEAVETYKSIGFEVHLEPLPMDENCDSGECRMCFKENPDRYRVIYIRPVK